MLYMEIISVCSQIHTKHINTLCGQNVALLNVKLAVHKAGDHWVTVAMSKVSSVRHCLPWGLEFYPSSPRVGFVVNKVLLGRHFSPSISVFPASHRSTIAPYSFILLPGPLRVAL